MLRIKPAVEVEHQGHRDNRGADIWMACQRKVSEVLHHLAKRVELVGSRIVIHRRLDLKNMCAAHVGDIQMAPDIVGRPASDQTASRIELGDAVSGGPPERYIDAPGPVIQPSRATHVREAGRGIAQLIDDAFQQPHIDTHFKGVKRVRRVIGNRS